MFSFLRRFRFRQDTDSAFIALDIGTEFVKCLILRIEEGHAFVLGYSKVRQAPGNMTAGAVADIAAVATACESALAICSRQAGILPDQAVIGIAGELVTGKTSQISFTRESPERRIDEAELTTIISRVQQRAFADTRTELARRTGETELDIKLVHAALLATRIDGAPVTTPIGFQGKEVTLSLFNAFAPLVHFGALQTIASELELDLLAILAEPFAVSRAFAFDAGHRENTIFIDVGGGTTDIAVVRGDDLALQMFALGGRTFTKRLAQTFQISYQDAEALKIAYSSGKAEGRTAQIQKAIGTDMDIWLAGVEMLLGDLAGAHPLPPVIYLCGGGARLPEMREGLISDSFYKSLPFSKRPQIRFLVPDDFSQFTDTTGTLRTIQDTTPLALAASAMSLVGSLSLQDALLQKALHLLRS